MSDSETDFAKPDTIVKESKIHLQKMINPDQQGEWIEMRDEETDEMIYYRKANEEIFYPFRNFGKGEIRNRHTGKLVKRNEEEEDEDNEDIPQIKSKFGKIRCSIVANYEKPKKSANDKETLVHFKTNSKNIKNVLKMQLEKEPLRFYYDDQILYDSNQRPLYIEWRGVKMSGGNLLKGDFYLRKEKNSQPARLLRKLLKLAGFGKEHWSTKSKKGSAIRAYSILTTRIDGKLYRLKDFFPTDTRKNNIPKKPKKKSEVSYDENEIL